MFIRSANPYCPVTVCAASLTRPARGLLLISQGINRQSVRKKFRPPVCPTFGRSAVCPFAVRPSNHLSVVPPVRPSNHLQHSSCLPSNIRPPLRPCCHGRRVVAGGLPVGQFNQSASRFLPARQFKNSPAGNIERPGQKAGQSERPAAI